MKKFYTLFAACAMTVMTVAAQDYTTLDELCGVYNWSNADLGGEGIDCAVTLKKDGKVENGVVITGLWDKYEVKGTFNTDDYGIYVERQRVGFDPDRGEFLTFVVLDGGDNILDEPLALDNYQDGDLMTFGYYGVVYETMSGDLVYDSFDDLVEYADMGWLIRMGDLPAADWEVAGTATLFDGGFFTPLPRFGIGFTIPVEVVIEKSTQTDGLYRLVNPWNSFFGKEYDSYLEFDISDPECVIIPTQATGHVDEEYGASYVQNFVGMYIAQGLGKEDAYAAITPGKEDSHICTYDAKNQVVRMPVNAMFTTFANDEYFWNVGKDNGAADSYIVMPGGSSSVSAVVVDEEMPVEYYNLQGIRIENPAAGQLVIRRQGNVASKVVM